MRIGLVVHGPEVVDSHMAKKIIDALKDLGEVSAIMAGTIGKTAVLDAHLENVIDIRKSLKPSQCIEEFFRTKDITILLNHGKTTDNGVLFANIVVSRLADRNLKPLIHIERPGMPDGKIIPWNTQSMTIAIKIADILGLGIADIPKIVTPISIDDQGHRVIRNVYGVHPGEKIMINGIVVGVARSSDVRIISEEGFIRDIMGAKVKVHGLEKLHGYDRRIPIDLCNCWVKSGPLRGNNFSVRKNIIDQEQKQLPGSEKNSIQSPINRIKAVIIDHEAERTFELADGAGVAVTIGDDTTDIAADILYRLRIPIIGITDGDIDGFSHIKQIYPGSTIMRMKPGSDDIVGKEIRDKIFCGKESYFFDSIIDLRNNIFTISKNYFIFSTYY
ncbi:DUF2117 family protein [Methanolobus sp. WCC5]|uniref:DUF2117 family protein n=1 Tax=Methanolobus sp. WCC5 TaxID=3125785 RepID=UPI003253853F